MTAVRERVHTDDGLTVATYDARGHGDSDWDPASRYDLDDGARPVSAPTLLVRGLLSEVVSEHTVNDSVELVPHAHDRRERCRPHGRR